MAAICYDFKDWSLSRDGEGYRTYKGTWLIRTTADLDGPGIVLNAAGLPAIGSYWAFGNDSDPWCFCTPEAEVKPIVSEERCNEWEVQLTFTNAPRKRCQDNSIQDPLSEPYDISGSFLKYTKEAVTDIYGNLLLMSSQELMRGPAVEKDANFPTVTIKKNQASIGLATYADMVDAVNDATLWGLSARKIKLEQVSWARKLYGTCSFYYQLQFDFKINFEGYDRKIIDEGTRTLMPGGTAGNQDHYNKKKDRQGENIRVLLNGSGGLLPAGASPYVWDKRLYNERNLLLLGIPSTI